MASTLTLTTGRTGDLEGDLLIGKDGASACAILVEHITRSLVLVGLP